MHGNAEIEAAPRVATYLAKRIGLLVTGSRRDHLLREISAAMAQAGAQAPDAYCARLDADPDAFAQLVARVTVGESYFFREPAQLDLLRTTILPERRAMRGVDRGLRLWSAGCAIGQEAYTLAIMLEEEGLDAGARILGTDISSEALAVAATAVYGSWSLRAVTASQRAEYFQRVAMGHHLDDRFARLVTFRQGNLLDPDPSAQDMDVILCRNVLIYLDQDAVERAASNLTAALAPGGWLVAGASDPHLQGVDGLEPRLTPAGLVYRRVDSPGPPAHRRPRAVRRDTSGRPPRARSVVRAATLPHPSRMPRLVPAASLPDTAEPVDVEDAVRRIRALGGSGALDAALDMAALAIDRFPLDPELRNLEAVVLLEAGRPLDAAVSARAALYLDAQAVTPHLVRARAESAMGNVERARLSLRHALALLQTMPEDAVVPMSDGESAGRLAAMARAHDQALLSGAGLSRARGT